MFFKKDPYFITSIFTILVLASCEVAIDFNDNQRGILSFEKVSINTSPQENIYIESVVYESAQLFGSDFKKTAAGNTEVDGSATLVNLVPDSYDEHYIYINASVNRETFFDNPLPVAPNRSSAVLLNLEGLFNNTLQIPEIELFNTGTFLLSLENTTNSKDEVQVEIQYKGNISFLIFEDGILTENEQENTFRNTAFLNNNNENQTPLELDISIPSTATLNITKTNATGSTTETIILNFTTTQNMFHYEY